MAIDEKAVFLDVLALPDAKAREAYLQEACGDHPDVLGRLRELLTAHEESQGPLDRRPAALGDLLDTAHTETPGTVIGPYKLLEQIGEGGFGVVYLAEQTHPVRRRVALKVLKPGMDSRQVIARFEAERQALALMDHPNIARVFDGGTTDGTGGCGRPYFVMEMVKGVAITRYCDEHKLTPRQRLELFLPVCQAVQHAHQKGIIHRDLKPSNVLVTRHDTTPVVKVIDFGVAKALGHELTDKTLYTGITQLIGTPLYMSPEQAGMSDLDVDTRSDIYSLGVLLYELLTGTTPFDKDRFQRAAYDEIRRIIREEEPPRPSTRLSDLRTATAVPANGDTLSPPTTLATVSALRQTEPEKLTRLVRGELDWIAMKCLEKDRGRRYETANALAQDVDRYLHDQPVQACPPSATYRFRKFARRNRGLLVPAGLAALALILGTVVSIWQAVRATDARNATNEQLRLTQQAEDVATQRLYRSLVSQAHASRLSRRVGQRYEALETLAEAARMARTMNLPEEDFLTLRNEAIACLALPDLKVVKEWDGFPSGTWRVVFDGRLERYARTDRQGTVGVRRVADDAELYRLSGMGPGESWTKFSPDGQYLVRGRLQLFELWKLTGPEPERLLTEASTAVGFSLDSGQFAHAKPDGAIVLTELPTGRPIKTLAAGPRATAGLTFHPTRRQIAVGHAGGVQVRDLETGRVLAELPQPVEGGSESLAWHPDANSLAVVGRDRVVRIWDLASGKATVRLEGFKNDGIAAGYNHSGNLLATCGWDGHLRLWDPRTGRLVFQSPIWSDRILFSPDDRLLALANDGNSIRIRELAPDACYRTLVRGPAVGVTTYFNATTRSDGRLLAVGTVNGADLWDLQTGQYLGTIPMGSNISIAHYEPSGALLVNGRTGFYRWPIRANPDANGPWPIGPPEKLPVPGSDCIVAESPDGRVLAVADHTGGLVLHADRPDRPVVLEPHADAVYITVSPDGRLVATGSHNGKNVKIWNARTGELEHVLPMEWPSWVAFSPDGKWLGTNGGGCRLWAVDGWRPGPIIGGDHFAFSPDGSLLAVETGLGAIRLVNPDTGKEYARLEDPNQDRAGISFTPDGSQIVTTSTNDSMGVHVWDLRAIREELTKLGLDWDLPAYPPPRIDPRPLQVRIDPGDSSRLKPDPRELARQTLDQRRRAVAANPNEPKACNNLAWSYLTAPDGLRDATAALPLARKAVELDPSPIYRNTLGLALYRSGHYREAVEALEINLRRPDDYGLAWDLYFLAMCYQKLGDAGRARQFFDLGDKLAHAHWEAIAPYQTELDTFRAEAAELLGVEVKKD
jgi:serine/threonine protein kinase/WD40 repeat protein